jgi:hypothetical protein
MFASLEILIGLAFVYLILALMVTGVTEVVASFADLRAKVLRQAISQMLDRPGESAVTDRFYAHDRIFALSEGVRKPAYIPSKTFAEVVRDLVSHGVDQTKVPILAAFDPNDEELEERFLDTMSRASGWYKRKAGAISGALAAVIVVLANADTLAIAHRLWTAPALRAAVVAQAGRRVDMGRPRDLVDANYGSPEDPVPSESDESAEEQDEADGPSAEDRAVLESLLGWSSDFKAFNRAHCERLQARRDETCRERSDQHACEVVLQEVTVDKRCELVDGALEPTSEFPSDAVMSATIVPIAFGHLVGWVLSIAAVSLGAPFWFDTLSRFVNLRGAGPVERPKHKGDIRTDKRTHSEAEATSTKEDQQ